MKRFRNFYKCDECRTEWKAIGSCACNSKCPTCNSEITPFKSEQVDALEKVIMRNAIHHMLKSNGLNDKVIVVDRDLLIGYVIAWMESTAEPVESLFDPTEEDGLQAVALWWTKDE